MHVHRLAVALALGAITTTLGGSGIILAQTQLQMTQSVDRSTRTLMDSLDAALKEYRARLSGSQRSEFDQSQRDWVAYRKTACEFESSGLRGGSAEGMARLICWGRYTAERLKHMQELLKCTEGDLTCPAFKVGT